MSVFSYTLFSSPLQRCEVARVSQKKAFSGTSSHVTASPGRVPRCCFLGYDKRCYWDVFRHQPAVLLSPQRLFKGPADCRAEGSGRPHRSPGIRSIHLVFRLIFHLSNSRPRIALRTRTLGSEVQGSRAPFHAPASQAPQLAWPRAGFRAGAVGHRGGAPPGIGA